MDAVTGLGNKRWWLTLGWFVAVPILLVATAAVAQSDPTTNGSFGEKLASTLEGSIASGQMWITLSVAWLGGLLTSFTPCVWPLVPITVRYFGAMQGAGRSHVIRLALIYVAGMTLLYSTLGVISASLGKLHGSFLANPWFSGAIALFCIAMGLSMLGLFTIQLPAALNTRLSQAGGSSHSGALIMGLVSGLIAAPCTGPVLLVVLTLIASTGRLFLGFWLMVAFSLGLGLPFLVIAVLSGRKIPSGGLWMDAVKTILATAMFVVAVYFLQIASPELRAVLVAVPHGTVAGLVVVVLGLVVAALQFGMHGRTGGKVAQVVSIALMTVGVALTLHGKGDVPSSRAPAIEWASAHEETISGARSAELPVMIDFTAEWCAACKELDHKTLIDAAVRAEAKRFVSLRIDATIIDEAMEALFELYQVRGLPSVVFVDSTGKILEQPRVTEFVPAPRFLELMRTVH